MKKFITLILFLLGVVVVSNATTRRFMAINQVSWLSVNIYASYDNNGTETAITDPWPGTAMTHWKSVSNWHDVWYVNLDIPDGVSTIKVVFNNGSDGGSNQTWDYKTLDISSQDKLFYIYDENDQENHGISPQELDYYISGWKTGDDNSDNSRTKLTWNSDGTYSCDLDFSSYTASGNRCVFPGFASGVSNDTPWVSWDFAIRPTSSSQVFGFENKNGSLEFPSGNDGYSWTLGAKVKYHCVFDFASMTWAISPTFDRDITSAGIATFSSEYAVAIPSGITASYVTGAGSNNVLTTTAFANGIPANTGALLTGEAGTYTFTPALTTDQVSGNKLVAKTEAGSVPQTEEVNETTCTNYVLTTQTVDNANAPARFYKVNTNGNTVGAGKAYLRLAPSDIATARDFFFIWEDDVTAINAVTNNQKMDGQAYNLAGQRIAQPTKGLYIVNGKKYIVK